MNKLYENRFFLFGLQRYFQVASRQLVGVYMSVWVRAELLGAISDVAISTVSTGWGGYLGNKVCILTARMNV